ncbi:MAG: TnsA endonuclease [Firmicutes bacterium]|nr:TnsA endonuclease [Bacillota bacterium]
MKKPIRKIKNYKGRNSIIGKFASAKMNKIIHWESMIERDYIFLLETDPDVTYYASQPLKMEYWKDGKKHFYTPDFLVKRNGITQIVEVKPSAKVEKHRELFQAIALYCEDKGWKFLVVTEAMVRVQPRLENAKILCRYSFGNITFDYIEECKNYLKQHGAKPLLEVKEHMKAKGYCPAMIYTLLYKGAIAFAIDQPINDDCRLCSE